MCGGRLRLREGWASGKGVRGREVVIGRAFLLLIFCVFHTPRQFVPPCVFTRRLSSVLIKDPVCRLSASVMRLERAVCCAARRPVLRGMPASRTQDFSVTSLTAPARTQSFIKRADPAHNPMHRT